MRWALAYRRSPASVGSTRRPERSRSCRPSRCSSERICRLTAGWVTPSRSAAWEKLLRSTTAQNAASWRGSISIHYARRGTSIAGQRGLADRLVHPAVLGPVGGDAAAGTRRRLARARHRALGVLPARDPAADGADRAAPAHDGRAAALLLRRARRSRRGAPPPAPNSPPPPP